jgi:hypothetical protein
MHASIFLKADSICGWTNADMALAYAVSTKKVEPLQQRVVAAGFDAALSRKPGPKAHRRNSTGDAAAPVSALDGRQAPAGQERWTLRRLADTMVEWDRVDSVSHETMRRTGKNMHVNRGKRQPGVCRRSPMPRVSATWRTASLSLNTRMTPRSPKCAERPCRPSCSVQSGLLSRLSLGRLSALTRNLTAMGPHTFAWLLTLALDAGRQKSRISERKVLGRTVSKHVWSSILRMSRTSAW